MNGTTHQYYVVRCFHKGSRRQLFYDDLRQQCFSPINTQQISIVGGTSGYDEGFLNEINDPSSEKGREYLQCVDGQFDQ